jgi:flagellar FliL protein
MSGKGEAQAEAGGQGGGKKKRLLVAGGAALMLALGGAGAWFFLGAKHDGHASGAKAKTRDDHPPVFVTLDPFVVNLAGEVEHYLQVAMNLKVADAKVPDQVKVHMPEIRNAVLLLLSSKRAEELATLEGKNQLRAEVRTAINRALGIDAAGAPNNPAGGAVSEAHAAEPAKGAEEPAAGVLDVLLTSFVIQ